MSVRSVHVLHLVVPRRVAGTVQVLFYPHPRWREARSGRPMMSLPTTSFAGHLDLSDERIVERQTSVLSGDLGLPAVAKPSWRRLADTDSRLVSPTQGIPTDYRITSTLTRLPVAEHGRVSRRLGGEWLSVKTALSRVDISPTARAVLERLTDVGLFSNGVSPVGLADSSEPTLTDLLLAARDGDLEQYGTLLKVIRPALIKRLHGCSWTRMLAMRSHEVEDVLADAAIQGLEHLESFDPSRGSALAWLWTIARNCAIDRLRKQKRIRGLTASKSNELMSRELDPGTVAAVGNAVKNLQVRLEKTLTEATPLARKVWTMRFDAALTYQEISETLKLPLGTIASWIGRIRRKVQMSL